MKLKDILDGWQDGDNYRAYVAKHCEITAQSRYKILGDPIEGLYGKLKNEAFVLRLTLKADPDDYGDVFVGNYAGPKLMELAGQEAQPCFNPLRSVGVHERTRAETTENEGQRQTLTAYNRELYTIINLCFIALRMNRTRKDGPISTCLEKLRRYGDRDLTDYWAWKMNGIIGKYRSSLLDINERLQKLDSNARVFTFPEIRHRLENDKRLKPEDILL